MKWSEMTAQEWYDRRKEWLEKTAEEIWKCYLTVCDCFRKDNILSAAVAVFDFVLGTDFNLSFAGGVDGR